jgi:hypothetical protein
MMTSTQTFNQDAPFFLCSHQVLNAGTDQVYCFLKQKKLKRKADLFLENDGDGKALLNTD